MISREPSGVSTVLTVEPLAAFSVEVTVPSFRVSTTVWEPSGLRIVFVTVPVIWLVCVVMVEPSGLRWVVVEVLLEPEEGRLGRLEPEEPPVAGTSSRSVS